MAEMNKGNPKIDALSEKDLTAYYEANEEDVSQWQKKPKQIRVRRGSPSVVFTMRLAPEELEAFTLAAVEEGISLSEFMRRAAEDRLHREYAGAAARA